MEPVGTVTACRMKVIPKIAMTNVTANDSKYSRKIDFGGPLGLGSDSALISASSLLIFSRSRQSNNTRLFAFAFRRFCFSRLQRFQSLTRGHHFGRLDRGAPALSKPGVPRSLNEECPFVRLAFGLHKFVNRSGKLFGL